MFIHSLNTYNHPCPARHKLSPHTPPGARQVVPTPPLPAGNKLSPHTPSWRATSCPPTCLMADLLPCFKRKQEWVVGAANPNYMPSNFIKDACRTCFHGCRSDAKQFSFTFWYPLPHTVFGPKTARGNAVSGCPEYASHAQVSDQKLRVGGGAKK